MNPLPWRLADDQLAAALIAEHRDDVGFLLELDEQPDRLAVAAAARQFRRLDGVEAAIGGEHQKLRRGLGEEGELQAVVGLERETGQIGDLAAQRANPALLGNHDGDRLALDQGLLDGRLVVRRRLRQSRCGACRAGSSARRCRARRLISSAIFFHCCFSERSNSSIDFFSARKILVLLADLHLFEPAQIAQPHIEDGVGLDVGQLEGLHQHGLRLVLLADDLDDLVEIEIGDEIAAQHFEPVLDLRRADGASGAAARRGDARAIR